MKNLLALLLTCCFLNAANANQKTLSAGIESVTVYLRGAEIARNGKVYLEPGTHELVVKELTPLVDKESVRVNGSGPFTVLAMYHQIIYLDQKVPVEKKNLLEAKLKDLHEKLRRKNVQLQTLRGEEQLLQNNMIFTTNENGTDLEKLKMAYLFTKEVLPALHLQLSDLQEEINNLNEDFNHAKQQLNAIATTKKTASSEIVIKVKVTTAGTCAFDIHYMVSSARWYPTYDIRVENIQKPMALTYNANVTQQTGEDWNNVKIKLSTASPENNNTAPKVKPWQLRFNQRPPFANQTIAPNQGLNRFGAVEGNVTNEYGEALPYASVTVPGSTVGTSTDQDGHFSLFLPPNAKQLQIAYVGYKTTTVNINNTVINIVLQDQKMRDEEVMLLQNGNVKNAVLNNAAFGKESVAYFNANATNTAQLNFTSDRDVVAFKDKRMAPTTSLPIAQETETVTEEVDFSIKERYSIPSDARHYTVQIGEFDVDAEYTYFVAPKYDKDVFLTAMLNNWENYKLLDGESFIYYEGEYVGKSIMAVKYAVDTLSISLGRDKNIQVEYTKVKDYSKNKLIGTDKVDSRKYEIKLHNGKTYPINLMVQDQYPVSADARIIVTQEGNSGAHVNDENGIVTWKLKLSKGESKALDLKYSVQYPANTRVYLE